MFESDWSTAYFDQWRVFDAVADSEIDAARRLAPLVGLRPWLSVDTSTGPWAEAVAALLGLLRTAMTRVMADSWCEDHRQIEVRNASPT